eukprot:CAMPEP_0169206704 /NCGR_PEP_ID=MMETSP1016-20121227/13183_1 /TAXON_ID=342587 /ORGANISM="Karlodinium micrum, Strain CCMP2283" /LENGTH=56 /DNA_ID=CAMNT_0009283915 /DNA_START=73 /DNA_END=243 /DNA_ORIENTATION=+
MARCFSREPLASAFRKWSTNAGMRVFWRTAATLKPIETSGFGLTYTAATVSASTNS